MSPMVSSEVLVLNRRNGYAVLKLKSVSTVISAGSVFLRNGARLELLTSTQEPSSPKIKFT